MEQRTCESKEPADSSCSMINNDGSQVADGTSEFVVSWTAVNRSSDERRSEVMSGHADNTSVEPTSIEPDLGSRDRNNKLHVDTSTDQAYVVGEAQQTRHYIAPVTLSQSMQSMRIHLASMLPKELITDEYGDMVPVEAVSSRHLAKLQSAIWHELPAVATFTFMGADDDGPGHRITTAQAVYWIGDIMSKDNRVFILNPPSAKPCNFALCEHVRKHSDHPDSRYEVSIESLVDWITLDPAPDAGVIWCNLYRRNKQLLLQHALLVKRFIPKNTLKLCSECFSYLAEERNQAWCLLKKDSNVVFAHEASPWRGFYEEDEKMEPYELSDYSDWSDSEEDAVSVAESEDCEATIPTTDGASDRKPKTRSQTFESWRDSVPHQGQGSRILVPRDNPTDTEVARESSSQIPGSHRPHSATFERSTGTPNRTETSHPSSVINFTPINPHSRSNFPRQYGHIEPAPTNTAFKKTERCVGTELGPKTNMVDQQLRPNLFNPPTNTNAADLVAPPAESERLIRALQILANDSRQRPFRHFTFQRNTSRWPFPKDYMSPMPAKPALGDAVIHESLYPHPKQLICSCRKAAETNTEKIVQCKNPECFVRWYHYKCLDRRGKAYGRHGNFLCDTCEGEEYWQQGKKKGETDFSVPFTKEELVQGIDGMAEGVGVNDPYGLCAYNGAAPDVGAGEPLNKYCEVGGVVYHEDEDDDKTDVEEMVPKKKQKATGELVLGAIQDTTDPEHVKMARMEEEMGSENIADTDNETDESSGGDVA